MKWLCFKKKERGIKVPLSPCGISHTIVPREYSIVWDIHITENNKNKQKIIYV